MASEPVTIIIGIASNDAPDGNFHAAARALHNLFPDLRLSTPQITPPLQKRGPDYLNAVAVATTRLSPETIINTLKQLEHNQGRLPADHDRIPLDLDLLAYGKLVSRRLRLPRPELYSRDFNRLPAQQLTTLPPPPADAIP